MAKISLGGKKYTEAQETTEFRRERDGLQVFKLIALVPEATYKAREAAKAKGEDPELTQLAIYFDIGAGDNKGIYKELTEKFPVEGRPYAKCFKISFNLENENAIKRLKGLITKIAEDEENKEVGDAIAKANEEGEIDDDLLKGTLIGIDTIWEQSDNGYWNLNTNGFKAWTTVEEALAAEPGNEKPKAEPKELGSDDFITDEPEDDGDEW